jgi:hypothetical protein
MTEKELVLDTLKRSGRLIAKDLQTRSADMTGTELYSEEDYIPDFLAACKKMNMLARPVGFVCKSTAGRVVRLLMNYDNTIHTQEPEELPAQWGFVWSTDPAKALPFISLSTSPFNKGDCCLNGENIPKRSNINNNVWSPDTNPEFWDDIEG